MARFEVIETNLGLAKELKDWLQKQDEVFPFFSNQTEKSALLLSYLLSREIGGPNDDLGRFILDETAKKKVDRSSLVAEMGIFGDEFCVRIMSPGVSLLSVTVSQLNDVVLNGGDCLILRPMAIADLIHSQKLAPVMVRDWIIQSHFSEFDPKVRAYQEKLWVLRNNDAMLYMDLISDGKVVLQGVHDTVAHASGINRAGFEFVMRLAQEARVKLKSYFGDLKKGNLPSHLIPFYVGLLIDDLAQAPFYGAQPRARAIRAFLKEIDALGFSPEEELVLKSFPRKTSPVLTKVRSRETVDLNLIDTDVHELVAECIECAVPFDPKLLSA